MSPAQEIYHHGKHRPHVGDKQGGRWVLGTEKRIQLGVQIPGVSVASHDGSPGTVCHGRMQVHILGKHEADGNQP